MVLLSIDWTNLHELLRSLYDEMMPLCEDMASVAKGVAGIGALFYVAYRVWQSLSRAEEIDVFPLFRPFVLGLCIMFFLRSSYKHLPNKVSYIYPFYTGRYRIDRIAILPHIG